MNYFIVDNGQQAGPYTIDELVRRGLNSDTLVWAEGMAEWTPAWQVEELKNYLYGQQPSTTPPPTPAATIPQPQYQQPQPEPTPQSEPMQPKKKGGHTLLWISLAIILFAAILLGVTCPERKQHQEVIQQNLTSALTSTVNDALPIPKQMRQMTGSFGEALVANIVGPLLNDALQYHNYIFFSTTSVEFAGKSHTTSFGLLGKVFTVGEADIAKTINESFGGKKESNSNNDWLSTSPSDDSNADADNADDSNESNEESADDESQEIVNDVKDVVKKHVKKNVNPNGDKNIGDAIDKLIDMI